MSLTDTANELLNDADSTSLICSSLWDNQQLQRKHLSSRQNSCTASQL